MGGAPPNTHPPLLPLQLYNSDDNCSAAAFNFCHFPGDHLDESPVGGGSVRVHTPYEGMETIECIHACDILPWLC